MALILFDMMDTLIDDPFYRAIHQLMDDRQRLRWASLRNTQAFLDFETGAIGESLYFRQFFKENADVGDLPSPQKLKKVIMKDVQWLPGIPGILRKIRHPMGIASNYSLWYRDIFRKRRDLPPFFQYHFFSCEMGFRKPESHFYRIMEDSLTRIHGEEGIVFFDDRQENLKIPLAMGWEAVHIDRDRAVEIIEDALLHLKLL